MAVNVIGANFTLAAAAVGESVASFQQSQYNPTPWDESHMLIVAGITGTEPQGSLSLSVQGEQILQDVVIPESPFSVLYNQIVRRKMLMGQTWQLTFSNPSASSVAFECNVYFYHANMDGSWDVAPTFFV